MSSLPIDSNAISIAVAETKIKVLEDDVGIVTKSLNTTITNIQDFIVSMTRLVTINEQKIDLHVKDCRETREQTEKHRTKITKDIEDLNQRVSCLDKNLSVKLTEMKTGLTSQIESLKPYINKEHKVPFHLISLIHPAKFVAWVIYCIVFGFGWSLLHINFPALSVWLHTIII